MSVSGHNPALLGRSAIPLVGASRASQRLQLDPVEPSDPLKDPTSAEYRALQDLKQRDREVRQHEQAHIAAGGAHVSGGAHYSYEIGPDGRRYAVGGEVSIDTSAVPNDPEATIRKMQAVRSAATAPAEPSAQDRAVAADAARAEARARAELRDQQSAADDSAAAPPGGRAQTALSAYRDAAGEGAGQRAAVLDLTA
ncbi:MAG: putative metalloprotease CJM1_0395 family protein [Gammaproteobacteria bacterium]|nr:putative metalloprotease CJM1_0395 family protein [Gammaproteobacteria bacterium]